MNKYYKTLELPYDAPWADVKQAYRDLVRVWHPDRFGQDVRLQQRATQKLTEINEAYTFLKKLLAAETEVETAEENIEFEPIDWSQCTRIEPVATSEAELTERRRGIRFLRWRWQHVFAGIPFLAVLLLAAFSSTSQSTIPRAAKGDSGKGATARETKSARETKRGANIDIPDEIILPLVGNLGKR